MTACQIPAIRTAAGSKAPSPIKFLSQWNFWRGRSMRRSCSRSPRPTKQARRIAERRRDLARSQASHRCLQRMAYGLRLDHAALLHDRLATAQPALAVLEIDGRQQALVER